MAVGPRAAHADAEVSLVSGTSARSMWVPSRDREPTGWFRPDYDDGAWQHPVNPPRDAYWTVALPGAQMIWGRTGLADGDVTLIRTPFAVPPGASVQAVALDVVADNIAEVWINGTRIGEVANNFRGERHIAAELCQPVPCTQDKTCSLSPGGTRRSACRTRRRSSTASSRPWARAPRQPQRPPSRRQFRLWRPRRPLLQPACPRRLPSRPRRRGRPTSRSSSTPAPRAPQEEAPVPPPAACRFVLGFAAIRELVGSPTVGECLDDQHSTANGNAEQHTTGGLLVWRKADNWTAFTDGYWTWINGPTGLARRVNDQRFTWEPDRDGFAIADPPRAPAVSSPAPQPAPPVAGPYDWARSEVAVVEQELGAAAPRTEP